MTVDQVREDYLMAISAAKAEMEDGNYDLAFQRQEEADILWDKLVRMIQAEDPHTTEADIRYFELGN